MRVTGRSLRLILIICLPLLAACKNLISSDQYDTSVDNAHVYNAIIINHTEASRQELQTVISDALGGRSVIIADNAFTHQSRLIIERKPHLDANGQLLNGRVIEKPIHFKLVIINEQCWLTKFGSDAKWLLSQTNCKAHK